MEKAGQREWAKVGERKTRGHALAAAAPPAVRLPLRQGLVLLHGQSRRAQDATEFLRSHLFGKLDCCRGKWRRRAGERKPRRTRGLRPCQKKKRIPLATVAVTVGATSSTSCAMPRGGSEVGSTGRERESSGKFFPPSPWPVLTVAAKALHQRDKLMPALRIAVCAALCRLHARVGRVRGRRLGARGEPRRLHVALDLQQDDEHGDGVVCGDAARPCHVAQPLKRLPLLVAAHACADPAACTGAAGGAGRIVLVGRMKRERERRGRRAQNVLFLEGFAVEQLTQPCNHRRHGFAHWNGVKGKGM